MRILILLATGIVVMLGVTILPTSGNAQERQWCARHKGVLHCMYATEEQCRASISGRAGTCVRRHQSMR
ncbi:DUF3551 domain-containing protein [Bradyrhizobium sp. ARR65]|uniref:DUF3551 domain-containing protein n=1 Tax=Bradyrhizobium sp. ARR65 TaxID=1040989 RepID=UPI0009FCD5F1|nr:DUF3551 domain-containing protein [Bradyrhizobium sp. ARR65]